MTIVQVQGLQILDSRGIPTVQCTIMLDDGYKAVGSVPSGLSRGHYEAYELRDGGSAWGGHGVQRAVQTINDLIAPLLIGHEPDVVELDALLLDLDGTENKTKLGANTILATSIAITRAQAHHAHIPLYELIAYLIGAESVSIPFPMISIFNGGAHMQSDVLLQECMIVPIGAQSYSHALEVSYAVTQLFKSLLRTHGHSISIGDNGGFVPVGMQETELLDLLVHAIAQAGLSKKEVALAIDVAASSLYDPASGLYRWRDDLKTSAEMIEWYSQLVTRYPIYSIEDGLDQDDWKGWALMTASLGHAIQIVGDDIFATNEARIGYGADHESATASIIKPSQIGCVTQALQAIQLCRSREMDIIISHRVGETNDPFIADLAVGVSAGQIKAGGLCHGERLAKYNRLLEIEDLLGRSALHLA